MQALPKLTPNEVMLAASHALLRRFGSLNGERGERMHMLDRKSWDNEIEGACAELAYCKWRGIYWTGCADVRARDAGDVDVRWTKYERHGGMIVYPHDSGALVLLEGYAPNFRAVGWAMADDCKTNEYLTQFGYLVPRDALRELDSIPRIAA